MSAPKIPASPAGRHLAWALEVIESAGASTSTAEVTKRFTKSFLNQVPPPAFLEASRQIAAMVKPFELDGFEGQPAPTRLTALLAKPSGDVFRLAVECDPMDADKIAGLVVQMAPDLRKAPAARSWKELTAKLGELASHVSFLAAEIVGDVLAPVHEIDSGRPLAIGSAFKLYVLGELARQVDAGMGSWDDKIAIEAKRKSIPSGELHNLKAGTKVSVLEMATKMISISDNTAADHLLFHIGRENAESAVGRMGHSKPYLNVPFLSTRELTVLKWGPDMHVEAYLEASPQDRRNLLGGAIAKAKLPAVKTIEAADRPVFVDSIEWFASADDLGRCMLALKDAGPEIRKILSVNPGLPFDRTAWEYVGFKGGGEPGVLNMTWLLKRFDGRWFTLACTLNDDERAELDVALMSALMMSAATLLVMQRRKVKVPRR